MAKFPRSRGKIPGLEVPDGLRLTETIAIVHVRVIYIFIRPGFVFLPIIIPAKSSSDGYQEVFFLIEQADVLGSGALSSI